ncbi:MAG: PAS domain-containing protein [Candidatus Wallbacteria bacterium]|nr:PAS domain-containing protein [Candidatus Wallbacteria bacterium]
MTLLNSACTVQFLTVFLVFTALCAIVFFMLARTSSSSRKSGQDDEADWCQVIDSVDDAIFTFNCEGRFMSANPAACRFVGRDPTGMLVTEIFPGSEGERKQAAISRLFESGSTVSIFDELSPDVRTSTVTGDRFFSTLLTPVKGRSGCVKRVVGIARDITEPVGKIMNLDRANKDLHELNKAREGFLINVSHELRTPLVAAKG